MDLPSLHTMLLPKLSLMDLRMPYPPSWYSHSITSDQRNSLYRNEVQQWAHAHRIRWSYDVPYHSKAACLKNGGMAS